MRFDWNFFLFLFCLHSISSFCASINPVFVSWCKSSSCPPNGPPKKINKLMSFFFVENKAKTNIRWRFEMRENEVHRWSPFIPKCIQPSIDSDLWMQFLLKLQGWLLLNYTELFSKKKYWNQSLKSVINLRFNKRCLRWLNI